MARASKKPKIGRPPRRAGERLSKNRTFRIRGDLDDWLQAAAAQSGRSVSEEIEYRLEQSFQREEAADEHTIDHYMVPLSEIGLWSPEYARIRHQGGHPPLPPEVVRSLSRVAKRAKVTPEEYWKRKLREHGVDPDAPYVAPPSAEPPEQS
jgi:hypothetical protein